MELQNVTKNSSADYLIQTCWTKDTSVNDRIIQIVALSIILVLSLVGNVLIICVVLENKLRKVNDLFLMNMAISDMVIPLIVLPNEINIYYTNKAESWPFDGVWGDFSCKFYVFIENISPSVSVLTLTCMSIDRFCAIVFPTKINLISTKTRNIMVIFTWIISSAVNSPYLYAMHAVKDKQGNNWCFHEWDESPSVTNSANNIYMIFNLLFHFIIPIAVLSLLYSIISVKLRAKKNLHSSDMARKRMATARRVTVMTVFIVGIFGLLWGPYFTIMTLLAFHWDWKFPLICSWPIIMQTVRFLTFAHAAVNPFVCFIFVEKYRRKITVALEKARGMTTSVLGMSRIIWGSSRSFTLQNLEGPVSDRSPTTRASHITTTTPS